MVPKYNKMMLPCLECLKDRKIHSLREIRKYIFLHFHLTDEDNREMLSSGIQSKFANRASWACTYLKKAGLIERTKRAHFNITEEGLKLLQNPPKEIDVDLLMKYENFRKFKNDSSVSNGTKEESDVNVKTSDNVFTVKTPENNVDEKTPVDAFEESFLQINKTLADGLLEEIIKLSPEAFEQMVIDLLSKMGYGSFENAGHKTSVTGDEGIDGIIMEDKLGFNLIYMQAKKWDLGNHVGRPEVQSFVGAISGKRGKGLFVTTSKYSKHAIAYAKNQNCILIDGEKLAKYMIEHNFGVSIKKTFEIKTIDTDVFNEYLDE